MQNTKGFTIESAAAAAARFERTESALNGRVLLPNGEECFCLAPEMTVEKATISLKASLEVNQTLIFYFDQIGLLPAQVVSVSPGSAVVKFLVKASRRDHIAAQLEWWGRRANEAIELRRAPRIVPLHRSVQVRLGGQIVLAGEILNISISGAAIRLETADLPFVGARVRIGDRFATVVRLIERGIAVQFAVPFPPQNFDERVRL